MCDQTILFDHNANTMWIAIKYTLRMDVVPRQRRPLESSKYQSEEEIEQLFSFSRWFTRAACTGRTDEADWYTFHDDVKTQP